ncbi:heavy-metal-associated domain-containing protein [Acetivibrio mesophilus]|uniref:Heavy-metal-associated domain-containing protein n=1 Tax=Acetivibrio mesophilus TaxID=2487273 RepID=A0A4Q0I3E4_9FIRM|nr:heavy metal-associated domain-containing protein [Acetivibrio mesophilus]ODM27193.1 heavy metal transporter [Clostridium sp. Bc-iso-3]RXE58773.1 heavy-metal-associated domain-containing protein [Acetivibrio mesophilus]
METAIFNVPSISCSACSSKIEENVRELKGIGNVYSDLKSQQVKIEYNPSDISPQEIKKHIAQMGYEII